MEATIENIGQFVDQEVTIKGWVYNTRSSGKIKFLILRDGTGMIQSVLINGETDPNSFAHFDELTQESSVIVRGRVRKEPRAPGGHELTVLSFELLHAVKDYPIGPKEHGTDFLMDHRHLWLRSSRQHAILRVRSELVKACRDFFDERHFTLIDAPIFTPSACEGTTTLFETEYFGEKAYLTQSGQLYMEAAAMAFGKVYCFGPTFRAEKSKTRRHLIEFWMIEPEMAYCDIYQDMDVAEKFVEYLVQRILKKCQMELKTLERNMAMLAKVKSPFPRISYDEAVATLKKKRVDFNWGGDFGGADETVLAEGFDKPFFVHHFPTSIKAFYMKEDPENPKTCFSMDLLAPEGYGEIIGGGQREDRLEPLLEKIKKHGLREEDFSWYLDLRRYGSVPHAGFGLGIERTLAWICGLPHVRETIPFPRMLNRLRP